MNQKNELEKQTKRVAEDNPIKTADFIKKLINERQDEATKKHSVVNTKMKHYQDVEFEPITMEVGFALIPIVNTDREGETLKDKINLMRKVIESELGVSIPSIRVADNAAMIPYTKYVIRINESAVVEGEIKLNKFLAIEGPYVLSNDVKGEKTNDPIFGESALWISEEDVKDAKDKGYTVIDALSILSSHLDYAIRQNISELIDRKFIHNLVSKAPEVLQEELKYEAIKFSKVQYVVKSLLNEGFSIRNFPFILENIIEACEFHHVSDDIVSYVRLKMGKKIEESIVNEDGKIYCVLLSEELENNLETFLQYHSYKLDMSPVDEVQMAQNIKQILDLNKDKGLTILTGRNDLRAALASTVRKFDLIISVVSVREIENTNYLIEKIGEIKR